MRKVHVIFDNPSYIVFTSILQDPCQSDSIYDIYGVLKILNTFSVSKKQTYVWYLFTACHHGYYGDDCRHSCVCHGNASCNKMTGDCNCTEPGWTGIYCDVGMSYFSSIHIPSTSISSIWIPLTPKITDYIPPVNIVCLYGLLGIDT